MLFFKCQASDIEYLLFRKGRETTLILFLDHAGKAAPTASDIKIYLLSLFCQFFLESVLELSLDYNFYLKKLAGNPNQTITTFISSSMRLRLREILSKTTNINVN